MTPDRRLAASALALALVVGACGLVTETQVVGPTPAPTEQGGKVTPAPTQGGQATAAPSGFGNATTAPGAPELEAVLPDAVGTETFTKSSFNGAAQGLAGAPFTDALLDPFLKASGKSLKDISWAVGTGSAESVVTVIRVKDVEAARTMALLGTGSAELYEAKIGEKTVRRGGAPGFWVVLYPLGDVLIWIHSPDQDQVKAILAVLP